MKNLLFVFYNLKAGGICRSVLNLFQEIGSDYNIDFLCFSMEGELQNQIPDSINILHTNKWLSLLGITQSEIRNKSFVMYLIRGLLSLFSRVFGSYIPHMLIFSSIKMHKKYDVAISCSHDINDRSFPIGCNDFVLYKVNANKKISFVHCDFENYGGNTKGNRRKYCKFDKVVCVSNSAKKTFIEAVPECLDKTNVVYNCINFDQILELSNSSPIELKNNDCVTFATVCRLSEEKGLLRAIECVNDIDRSFKWIIVGSGPLENEIRQMIEKYNLQNRIELIPSTPNPYRIIKNCDFFFLPSIHECAPMVFNEALALGIPVLTTKTCSAEEMISDRYGWVCDNSNEGILEALEKLLIDPDAIEVKRKRINLESFSNKLSVEQFHKVIDND